MRVMKFNIYDKLVLEITWNEGRWRAFRLREGRKIPESDLVIPPDLVESELVTFLDDMFHEWASPGSEIERME